MARSVCVLCLFSILASCDREAPSVPAARGRTATNELKKPPYDVEPNRSGFPFPTMRPVFKSGDRSFFDWERYVAEATSPADRVYRAREAWGSEENVRSVAGAGPSNTDDMIRFQLAAKEVKEVCEQMEMRYRDRLKGDEQALRAFEQFVIASKQAMDGEVEVVGGSWRGGSGARVAFPSARLGALLGYRDALVRLASSLHFQN